MNRLLPLCLLLAACGKMSQVGDCKACRGTGSTQATGIGTCHKDGMPVTCSVAVPCNECGGDGSLAIRHVGVIVALKPSDSPETYEGALAVVDVYEKYGQRGLARAEMRLEMDLGDAIACFDSDFRTPEFDPGAQVAFQVRTRENRPNGYAIVSMTKLEVEQ